MQWTFVVSTYLDCAGKTLDLNRACVMGVLNITPDSFSDGGAYMNVNKAIDRALAMVSEGAAVIDIGGESTRPGARKVSEQEELDRVLPVLEALVKRVPIPISIDTSKPAVMRAAVESGAGMINDVYALRVAGALEAARDAEVPVCLMHMQGEPATMQRNPQYANIVQEVTQFLSQRVDICMQAGIPRDRLIVDPGFGFGKALAHNLSLLHNVPSLVALGFPVLVGLSRKSMLGALVDKTVGDRVHASVAAAVIAVYKGARIVRAHDICATIDALRVVAAVQQSG